jgi:hypothetical protein
MKGMAFLTTERLAQVIMLRGAVAPWPRPHPLYTAGRGSPAGDRLQNVLSFAKTNRWTELGPSHVVAAL